MDQYSLIEEIVNKECERYELETTHFITDREKTILKICNSVHEYPQADWSFEDFCAWKETILTKLYVDEGFNNFLQKSFKTKSSYALIKRILINFIEYIKETNKDETIDNELRIESSRTMAFKLSSNLFSEIYDDIADERKLYITPAQMEMCCEEIAKGLFPLTYPTLIERLSQKDNEYWNEIYYLINRFASFLISKNSDVADKKYSTDEISMESVLSIQEQMIKGKLQAISSATHFLFSIRKTCRNKMHEFLNRNTRCKEDFIESTEWEKLEENIVELSNTAEIDNPNDLSYLTTINENNDYELSSAIAQILCCKNSSIYNLLVGTQESKVQILLMHYVEGLTYESISNILYEQQSIEINVPTLRQNVKRVKQYLKRRMIDLIIEYRHSL